MLRDDGRSVYQRHGGRHDAAAWQRELADGYRALHQACRRRETVFAAAMADRADWEAATLAQRHLAVAVGAELRRRHPDQRFTPLRPAEPPSATPARRDELTLTAGQLIPGTVQGVKDLAAGHRAFARTLAERQNLMMPSEDPGYGDLGQAFPPWPGPARGRHLAAAQAPDPPVP